MAEDAAAARVDLPWRLGPRDWLAALGRIWNRIGSDQLSLIAAGIAFYMMLSLFPMIGALGAVYGLIADAQSLADHLDALRAVTPPAAFDLIASQVRAVAETPSDTLSFGAGVGFLVALWLARTGVAAAISGINVAYEETEQRNIVVATLLSIALAFALVLLVSIALFIVVFAPVVLGALQLGGIASWLVAVLRWPLGLATMILALGLLYRVGPERSAARVPWLSPGALAATLLWLAASAAFSLYVSNFGQYNETYGSLGAIVVMLTWLYLTAFIVLLGAELNAELERQTLRDTTTGPERPMGERGAVVADSGPSDRR